MGRCGSWRRIDYEIDSMKSLKDIFQANRVYDDIKADIMNSLGEMSQGKSTRTLYRFISFPKKMRGTNDYEENEVIKDIRLMRISLANPMLFNDPMDPIVKVWIEKYCPSLLAGDSQADVTKVMGNFRICSMVHTPNDACQTCSAEQLPEPYLNTLMWGYYTGNHTGICIKYKITQDMLLNHSDDKRKLILGDVRYRQNKEMSDCITFENALLAKSSSWQHENETRLIYFTERNNDLKFRNGRQRKYCSLDGFEIEAIYMGYKITGGYKQAIKNAIIGMGVELYQMEFDMNDITKLKENREF